MRCEKGILPNEKKMALDKTAEAVEALHQTMVMLREELSKKNAKIKVLEKQLNKSYETITVEQEDPEEITTINNDFKMKKDFDNSVEKNIVENNCDDLVHEFHISDEEEQEERQSYSGLKFEKKLQYSMSFM